MAEKLRFAPIPEEYENFSREQVIKATEKYFDNISGIYEMIATVGASYKNKINGLLKNGAAVSELAEIMLEKDFEKLCYYEYECCSIVVLCQIAMKEDTIGLPHIFHNVQSITEACELMQKVIFGIRRVELGWEDEKLEDFLSLIQREQISYICIAEMLCQSTTIYPLYAADRIARLLYARGMKKEAAMILVLTEEAFPDSNKKNLLFAEAFLDMDMPKQAYLILNKYKKPNEEIVGLQRLLGEKLGI